MCGTFSLPERARQVNYSVGDEETASRSSQQSAVLAFSKSERITSGGLGQRQNRCGSQPRALSALLENLAKAPSPCEL